MYVAYCCVPKCRSWAKRNPELHFHHFPEAGKHRVYVETKLGIRELVDRRKIWIRNFRMEKPVSKYMKACSLHFKAEDYFNKSKNILKKTAVPTLKLPLQIEENAIPGPSARSQRVKKRDEIKEKDAFVCNINREIFPELVENDRMDIKIEDMEETNSKLNETNAFVCINREIFPEQAENDRMDIKIEDMEEMNIKLEDLHHSIDIKEEPSSELDQDCQQFECRICNVRFTSKLHLKRHAKIHIGEKQLECNICSFKSSYKRSLENHVVRHTGEKPFECTICGYKSILKTNFNRHLLTHSGKKPFDCTICDYKCFKKIQLQKHLQTHRLETG